MNFLQESQIMKALYEAQAKRMTGAWYEHLSEDSHRIVIDYKRLGLLHPQEQQLQVVLKGACGLADGQSLTRIVEKDAQGRITTFEFRDKASAHHLLLRLETAVAKLEQGSLLKGKGQKGAAGVVYVVTNTHNTPSVLS